jgi:hypothetical protein
MKVLSYGENQCVDCTYNEASWQGYWYEGNKCWKCLGETDTTCDVCDDGVHCLKCKEPQYFLMIGNSPRNCQTCKWDEAGNYYYQKGHFAVIVTQNPKSTIQHSNYCYRSCATYCHPGPISNSTGPLTTYTPATIDTHNPSTTDTQMTFTCATGTKIDTCLLCQDQYSCLKCDVNSQHKYVLLLPDPTTKQFNVHKDKCVQCNNIGQMPDIDTGLCYNPCVEFCEVCDTYNTCKRCLNGYFLKDSKTCKQCSENCQECLDNNGGRFDNTACMTCNSTHVKMVNNDKDCVLCNEKWQVKIGKKILELLRKSLSKNF